jgi:hypothetical protein
LWRYAHHYVNVAHDLLGAPLHRISEIHGNAESGVLAQPRPTDRKQISISRLDDRHRMNTDAEDLGCAARHCLAILDCRGLGRFEEPAHRVKQERPGPAGRIEHALRQRPIDDLFANPLRQPIRRVVFTEIVPLLRIDKRLVQRLQRVVCNIDKAET